MKEDKPKLYVIEGGKGKEVAPDLSRAKILNEELRQRRQALYQSLNEYVQANVALIIMKEIPEIDENSPEDLLVHTSGVVKEMVQKLDRYINSRVFTEIVESVGNTQDREQLAKLSADLKRLLQLLGRT